MRTPTSTTFAVGLVAFAGCFASLAAAAERTAKVYIQPIVADAATAPPPSFLAEVLYDPYLPSEARVVEFAFPELGESDARDEDEDEDDEQTTTKKTPTGTGAAAPTIAYRRRPAFRVGVYDATARRWTSATSVAAAENFAKGYGTHVVLSVAHPDEADGDAAVVSAALRGVRIDAGATRDFGPKALVRVAAKGEQVSLGKPVVLSPEGKAKVAGEQEEKTFLQK
jgi:hypothetical protein